jgi:pantoate--beta-alanine ligase
VEVTASPDRFREAANEARERGLRVGFAPTMGALHRGHASLIERARAECDWVAVSIFVNPLQFDSATDLAAYPRTREADRAMAESLACDLAFAPGESEMYPNGSPAVTVDPGPLGDRLEGSSRLGHFRGVLTAVAKLFNLAGACLAYFGEKDAQQLALVRLMVTDLELPVQVVPCPTVREPDGLALSSRNALLAPDLRRAAPVLFEALSSAAGLVRGGERRGDVLRAAMAKEIGSEPLARLDYVAVVDDATWEDVGLLKAPARALVAARFGPVRLIDNLALPWDPRWSVQNTGVGQEGR